FAAVAIRNRLVERFGERVERVWAFPTRERLAAASEEELFALGFSRRKAEYVVGLARSDVDLAGLALLPDEEVAAQLTALRGPGFLDVVSVRPEARRSGLAAQLVREVAAQMREGGVEMLELEVLASNAEARAIYDRWGFKPVELTLGAPLAQVEQRLAPSEGPT